MGAGNNLEARQLLLHEMREWSEECFSALWMRDLEFDLWNIVVNEGGIYGSHMLDLADANELYELAIDADGWWRWGETDEEFVGLDAWRNIYSNRMNSIGLTEEELEMGADRWGKCPRCIKLHNEGVAADKEALVAAYGTVSADEFLRMKSELDDKISSVLADSLRQDYELWMDESGVFSVDYSAICSVCGFKYKYHESEEAL